MYNNSKDSNISSPLNSTTENQLKWEQYFDTAIIATIMLTCLFGNIVVIKTSAFAKTKFAQLIMSLFSSLAVTDLCVCFIRLGIFLVLLHLPKLENGPLFCLFWTFSLALVSTSIWEHFFVAVQRLFIIKAFPMFRKFCTISLLVSLVIAIAVFQLILNIATTINLQNDLQYDYEYFNCKINHEAGVTLLIYRVVVLGVFTIMPLIATIIVHFWVVYQVRQATSSQKADEKDTLIKIAKTTILRSILLILCCLPYLLLRMMDPYENFVSGSVLRYLDYLMCAHSAISPIITLQDSDFGDALPNRRLKRQKRNSFPFNSTIRPVSISVITSENLKTMRSNE